MKLQNLILMLLTTAVLFSCKKDDGVEPANEAPQITTTSIDAPEDTEAGTTFATIQATDPEGDDYFFSLDASETMFQITADGGLQLKTGQQFDRATASQHTVNVTVTDEHAAESESTVTINVTEAEEEVNQAPDMDPQEFNVLESATPTDVILTIDAQDLDEDPLTFEITVDDDELFQIDAATGEVKLREGQTLDFEAQEQHVFTVRSWDGISATEAQMTVSVQNIIDLPLNKEKSSFVTTWTVEAGETVFVGTAEGGLYNYKIEWGDGTVEDKVGSDPPSHQFGNAGTFTIAINGQFPGFVMANSPASASKLTSMEQWGTNTWTDLAGAFYGCVNMEYKATDAPDLTQVTDLTSMFEDATSFNADLDNWNVENITNMKDMFSGTSLFNGDISNWDVSKVENMSYMFDEAISFNQDVGDWVVIAVTNMSFMFYGAEAFDQDLNDWVVSKVENMSYMFDSAIVFNQNLGGWNINNVNNMAHMLDGSGMSRDNYDASLIGWANNPNTPDAITLGAAGLYHCFAFEAVDFLDNTKEWFIEDKGIDPECNL
ncbi:BspA family leucine-rich repeat surface protein [Flagellimonas flava]|uniref:BspA family leucine-rich repeat surface protein n=1 Tax=Flagellimonas flava TaxID=570519 RepID=UPI003D6568EC